MRGKAQGLAAAAAALAVAAPAGSAWAHGPSPPTRAAAIAGPASPAEVVAMRQRFFGERNVDPATGALQPRTVILSWAGVATFAAAIDGHVVLLDAWTAQESHPGYVPATAEDLAKLSPEAIFIGHAHFDHALDAGPIAAASGAVVVGTPAHCADARQKAAGAGEVRCLEAMPQAAPFGETRPLGVLPGVGVTVVRHRHSPGLSPESVNPESFGGQPGDDSCPAHLDYAQTLQYPPDVLEGLRAVLAYATGADGGVLMFRFAVGDFSLAWDDSSASLGATPSLEAALRLIPPTDVFVSSLASLNQGTRCMRDPRMYAEALRARMFVPNHHDNNLYFPLSGPGSVYEPALVAELERVPAERRPCLRFISDPADYVKPDRLTFDVRAADPCVAADIVPRSGCLPRRLRVNSRGLARIGFGRSRTQVLRRAAPPARVGSRSVIWCVKGGGRVGAVFGRRGRVRLLVTTARGHRAGPLRRGSRVRQVRSLYRTMGRLGAGVRTAIRPWPRSRLVFGLRRGRVRFVAIAHPRLKRSPAALRSGLRRLRALGLRY